MNPSRSSFSPLSDVRELVAYLPYRLGFYPHESCVYLHASEPHAPHLGPVARIDLGDIVAAGPELVRAVVQRCEQAGPAVAAKVVLFSRHDSDVLTAATHWRAALPDLAAADLVMVGPNSYRHLTCPPRCCPRQGHPLSDVQGSVTAATMVAQGRAVLRGRESLVIRRRREPLMAVAIKGMWRRQEHTLEAGARRYGWFGSDWERWCRTRSQPNRPARTAEPPGPRPSRKLVGRLAAGLRNVQLRDQALGRLLGEGSGDISATLTSIFRGPRLAPSADFEHAIAAWEELCEWLDGRARTEALAVLGWGYWWWGDGARAGVIAQQVLFRRQGHVLGSLLQECLSDGIAPSWATGEAA